MRDPIERMELMEDIEHKGFEGKPKGIDGELVNIDGVFEVRKKQDEDLFWWED